MKKIIKPFVILFGLVMALFTPKARPEADPYQNPDFVGWDAVPAPFVAGSDENN